MLLLASIASPKVNTIHFGPLTIHYYGILIGLGVLVAAIVTQRRYERFGGDRAILDRVIMRTVLIGFVGARLAYVSTHSALFHGRWYATLFVWEGGLTLFGGLVAGALAAVYMMRKLDGDFPAFDDAVAVGLPLAQAIGRFGNYFNQELFGTPTTLPWGLEIDAGRRPAAYLDFETFHPTFLYEALGNLLVTVPVILLLERRNKLARGARFPVYMMVYGVIRFLTELLRTDTTFRLLGISRNGYVALGAVLGGAVLFSTIQRRAADKATETGEVSSDVAAAATNQAVTADPPLPGVTARRTK